jgi:VWFA-related protein
MFAGATSLRISFAPPSGLIIDREPMLPSDNYHSHQQFWCASKVGAVISWQRRNRLMALRTRRLTSCIVLFLALHFNSQLWAQGQPIEKPIADVKQSSPTSVPKFTSKSQLVLVPVVVTGKNGTHIGGLSRDAFKIEEHGKPRETAIFEEVNSIAPSTRVPSVETEGRSNFSFTDSHNWRLTLVVLDMLNTPYLAQSEAKKHLIQYLSKSLQRDEPTALFGLGSKGLKQLHPFSHDTGVLIAALKKVQGRVESSEANEKTTEMIEGSANSLPQTAEQISNFLKESTATLNAFQQREAIRTTLTAMTEIAHAYAAIPGRKTMIWASGGFPFMIDDPQSFARMGVDMVEKYEQTWRALMAANIAVYAVDVTGLGTSSGPYYFDASRSSIGGIDVNSRRTPTDNAAQKQATLRAFSAATGGTPCLNTNDLEGCFAHAVDDSRSYYLLGYYLPSDDQRPGWRKLKVKVSAEGARVRARDGFYVPSPLEDTPKARDTQLVEALRSPVEFTGVRLNVREVPMDTNIKSGAIGNTTHEFAIGIVGKSLTIDTQNENAVDITVIGYAFTSQGSNGGKAQEKHLASKLKPELVERVRTSGLTIKLPIELTAGSYNLKFAVRDNLNGEVGSVEYPLEVK